MTLTPSQRLWADRQIGDARTVAHTGTITKIAAKGDNWLATVEDDDKMAATVEMAGVTKATSDSHVGVETTVRVEGTIAKVIDNDDGYVTFEVTAPNGKVYDRVHPPQMTEAEREERTPAPPTPEEQAQAEADAQAAQEAAEAEREATERAAFKAILLDLIANDPDVQAALAP